MRKNLVALFITLAINLAQSAFAQTIKIGIDAEFGIPGSTSAQAIQLGAQVAVDEINAAGGVLGKNLEIVAKDNRGVPARALNNLRDLATDASVVAVMCGRYSPVAIELLPEIHRLKILYLDPWASANAITEKSYSPHYVFRLSLRDDWAMQKMMKHASSTGAHKVGLLLANSEWGRSNLRAAERIASVDLYPQIVAHEWFSWGEKSLLLQYQRLLAEGAQAIILVTNEREGGILLNEMAALPASRRLPVIAHWGLTAGQFFELAEDALKKVRVEFVQTFSFLNKGNQGTKRLLAGIERVSGNGDPRKIASPVGVAHAYDLVHLLARAISQGGSLDREKIRHAMEHLGPYQGVTRKYERPFTAQRHDALSIDQVFMARFGSDGAIEPLKAVVQ
jgi:branched-chain amino acid transport system substrate-binding protein